MRKLKNLTAVCKDCDRACYPAAKNGEVDGLCSVCRGQRAQAEMNRAVGSKGWLDHEGAGYEHPVHTAHVSFEELSPHDGLWYPDSSIRSVESELFHGADYDEDAEPFLLRPRPRRRFGFKRTGSGFTFKSERT